MNAIPKITDAFPCQPAWGISVNTTTKTDWQVCQTSIVAFLRSRFPESTEYHVQSRTGIPAGTVSNWLYKDGKPSFQHASIMICAFGPSFLEACIVSAPAWVSEAVRRERLEQLQAQRDALEQELRELTVNG